MKATSTARSPFPWFGGKQRMADRIVGLFPPHGVYVEVFGGGASVLFSKPPGQLDVYNDVDDGLVNSRTRRERQPTRSTCRGHLGEPARLSRFALHAHRGRRVKRWCRVYSCDREAAEGSEFCQVKHGWWEKPQPKPVKK